MTVIMFIWCIYVIDQPDIWFNKHGEYALQIRFGPSGEIIGFAQVGFFDRTALGLSYGASNLIGAGNPGFYKKPGIQARVLVFEQNYMVPQVILGFDNQGYGVYDSLGYDIMSKGIYLLIGENFEYPGLGVKPSIGFNYSFEQNGRFDMFGSVVFSVGDTHFLMDYTPNFNGPDDQNKGYLNMGIRFVFFEQMFFEFALRDLLDNSPEQNMQLNRMIKIGYRDRF